MGMVLVAIVSAGAAILAAVLTGRQMRNLQDRRMRQELLGKLRGLRDAHINIQQDLVDVYYSTWLAWKMSQKVPDEPSRRAFTILATQGEQHSTLTHLEEGRVLAGLGEAFGLLIALYPGDEKHLERLALPVLERTPSLPAPPSDLPFPIDDYNDKAHGWKKGMIESHMDGIAAEAFEPVDALVDFLKGRIKAAEAPQVGDRPKA